MHVRRVHFFHGLLSLLGFDHLLKTRVGGKRGPVLFCFLEAGMSQHKDERVIPSGSIRGNPVTHNLSDRVLRAAWKWYRETAPPAPALCPAPCDKYGAQRRDRYRPSDRPSCRLPAFELPTVECHKSLPIKKSEVGGKFLMEYVQHCILDCLRHM
jgi:hypothetical protein